MQSKSEKKTGEKKNKKTKPSISQEEDPFPFSSASSVKSPSAAVSRSKTVNE
jgi:hypothetical protein